MSMNPNSIIIRNRVHIPLTHLQHALSIWLKVHDFYYHGHKEKNYATIAAIGRPCIPECPFKGIRCFD